MLLALEIEEEEEGEGEKEEKMGNTYNFVATGGEGEEGGTYGETVTLLGTKETLTDVCARSLGPSKNP